MHLNTTLRSVFVVLSFLFCYNGAISQVPRLRHELFIRNKEGGAVLNRPKNVFIQENYAYVLSYGDGHGGLSIIDISDSENLIHKGSLSDGENGATLFQPTSVYVIDNYAYVCSSEMDYVEIIDVSDASRPFHLKKININNTGNHTIFSFDSRVYVASVNRYFFLITDITDPNEPIMKGSINDGEGGVNLKNPGHIFVSDLHAYIVVESKSSTNRQVQIIDFTNINTPINAGVIIPLGSAENIVVIENLAYVAKVGGLEIIDISVPNEPVLRSSIENGTDGAEFNLNSSMYVTTNYAYIGGSYNIEIVDVSNPDNATHVALITNDHLDGAGNKFKIRDPNILVHNDILYNANWGYNTFDAINVSDPVASINQDHLVDGEGGPFLENAYCTKIHQNHAYVTAGGSLNIFDISDPKKPVFKSVFNSGTDGAKLGTAVDLSVLGNYAYVVSYGQHALEIIDITDPSAPKRRGGLSTYENGALLQKPTSIVARGHYAYITSQYDNALEIIDISNPALPKHASNIIDGENGALLAAPSYLYLGDDLAYIVSAGDGSLEIVDVSNPIAPVHKGSLLEGEALLRWATHITVVDKYAYVTSFFHNALEIIDISDPTAPKHVSNIIHGQDGAYLIDPRSVTIIDNYAFVTTRSSIEIIDISNPNQPKHFANLINGKDGAVLEEPNYLTLVGDYLYATINGFDGTNAGLEIISRTSPPSIPYDISTSEIKQTSFTFNWNTPFNASHTIIDVSSDNFQTIIKKDTVESLSYSISNGIIQPGTEYQYRLSAFNEYGTSDFSYPTDVLTIPPTPFASAGVINSERTGFYANWSSVKGVQYYNLAISTDSLFTPISVDFYFPTHNVTTYFIENLVNDKYFYKVSATNASGESPFSLPIKVSLEDIVLGLNEEEMEIAIFPNPVNNFLTINLFKIPSNTLISVDLFNNLGQKMISKYFKGGAIQYLEMSQFQNGIYSLRISYENVLIVKSIAIIN